MQISSSPDLQPNDTPRRRETFLTFSPPYISELEIAEVVDTLKSDWITTGPKTRRFEQAFAAYLGVGEALALNSCTGALHTALASLGIGRGDEVITTPMTFASTANVIEHTGATPILADIEADTLNIDPAKIVEKLSPRTRAIIPVHYAGHPAEMDTILEISKQHNLYVIEDAAHAFPARYKGKQIGTFGNFTAFSFYATKNLTTSEGGMLTGSSEALERARLWSLHGMSRDAWQRYSKEGAWYYEVLVPGFKYNMTDIQAALGLVQLERIDSFQKRRREIVSRYQSAFSNHAALEIPAERPSVDHAWHLYVLRLRLDQLTLDRSQFISELKHRNIGTSVHFIPLHLHPYYRDRYNLAPETYPIAYQQYQRCLSLPLHPRLTDQDTDDVIEAVIDTVKCHQR